MGSSSADSPQCDVSVVQHGFARNLAWDVHSHSGGKEGGHGPEVVLSLADNDQTRGKDNLPRLRGETL